MKQIDMCYLVATKISKIDNNVYDSFERIKLLPKETEKRKDVSTWTDYIGCATRCSTEMLAKLYINNLVRNGLGTEDDFWVMPLKISYEW